MFIKLVLLLWGAFHKVVYPAQVDSLWHSPPNVQIQNHYLLHLMLVESGWGIVKVQDSSRRLDDISATLCTAEAVVPGQSEVLVAVAAIRQLKHLTRNHRLLLGHTGGKGMVLKMYQFASYEQ